MQIYSGNEVGEDAEAVGGAKNVSKGSSIVQLGSNRNNGRCPLESGVSLF